MVSLHLLGHSLLISIMSLSAILLIVFFVIF